LHTGKFEKKSVYTPFSGAESFRLKYMWCTKKLTVYKHKIITAKKSIMPKQLTLLFSVVLSLI